MGHDSVFVQQKAKYGYGLYKIAVESVTQKWYGFSTGYIKMNINQNETNSFAHK